MQKEKGGCTPTPLVIRNAEKTSLCLHVETRQTHEGVIMKNSKTKIIIAETFINMSKTIDPLKITVRDISETLQINRKTFYYHFPNKDIMINWIFRRDLGHMLKDSFPQSQLIFEPKDSSPYAKYPFYVHAEGEAGNLNHDEFFLILSRCFNARPEYYSQVLKSTDVGSLRLYLFQLYKEALEDDIAFLFRGEQLSRAAIDFLSEFYTAAFLGQMANRVISSRPCRTLEEVSPFSNIIHESLYLMGSS